MTEVPRIDLDTLLERGESVCGEHRKVWPECADRHEDAAADPWADAAAVERLGAALDAEATDA